VIFLDLVFEFNETTCGKSGKMDPLKVVSSENQGGSKIAVIVRYWSGTVALGIILNFNFAVVSY
jgi:hypothetical protein